MHRRGLVALGTLLLIDHEAHLAADREPVEDVAHHGMAVEIDLLAVARADEAMVLLGEQPHHRAMPW